MLHDQKLLLIHELPLHLVQLVLLVLQVVLSHLTVVHHAILLVPVQLRLWLRLRHHRCSICVRAGFPGLGVPLIVDDTARPRLIVGCACAGQPVSTVHGRSRETAATSLVGHALLTTAATTHAGARRQGGETNQRKLRVFLPALRTVFLGGGT